MAGRAAGAVGRQQAVVLGGIPVPALHPSQVHVMLLSALTASANCPRHSSNCSIIIVLGQCPCRESRADDLMRIADLEATVAAQHSSIQQSEEKLANMRSELLLREDNYNKTFSNGGAGQRALAVDKAMTAQQVNIFAVLRS